jgi:hypothetical protein
MPTTRVLILGDGNFSFSSSFASVLVRLLHTTTASHEPSVLIFCTSFDSRDELVRKYPESTHHIQQCLRYACVRILHNIDATYLRVENFGGPVNMVVFNFPHLGIEDCGLHASLIAHIFHSARNILLPGGTISIALSEDQSKRWRLVEVCMLQ